MFTPFCTRWQLTPDGEPITTPTSQLLPVRFGDRPAMLKIATIEEEKRGGALMAWWDGGGAAHVLALDGDTLLLERAMGAHSLAGMARTDSGDDDACRIICGVIARLHAPRQQPAPEMVPLTHWFRDLAPAAAKRGGILTLCSDAANDLLSEPQDEVVLHGDIHHGNVLDFGERGWLAIDPKGLRGERGFDYANLFCNPDPEMATAPGRLARQAALVAEAAGLERERLLRWVMAWSGLSAVWMRADGDPPETAFAVAAEAARLLAI